MKKNEILSLAFLEEDLKEPAGILCAQLGIVTGDTGTPVYACAGEALKVSSCCDSYKITYRRKCEFFRAFGLLKALKQGKSITQTGNPEMLCYMADASRDAVPSMNGLKKLIVTLASMGYDSLMLYTEDTYEIPEYRYFGHMRGRYTEEEIREADDYAFMFGIELIPCIQTLAHLGTAIRWPEINAFSDTGEILLAGDDRTYEFVKAALEVWRRSVRSRRINLGMDEAHALGLGRYIAKNGYTKPSDIMLAHLDRVAGVCKDVGFEPMIWSDMFFHMAFNGSYRVRSGEIAKEIMDKVPSNVSLVYWDYYSIDRQIFDHMVECHQKFNNEVLFAGGAWKWSGFAPHNRFSLKSTKIQLDSCAEHGLKKVIVTGWGDNGGEASQFSTLPVLLYFADRLYKAENIPDVSDEEENLRCISLFGISREELLLLDSPNEVLGVEETLKYGPVSPCKYLVYNDPLEGLLDRHMNDGVNEVYSELAAKLAKASKKYKDKGYTFETLYRLCDFLSLKAEMGRKITKAYLEGDKKTLSEYADVIIPAAIKKLDAFEKAFKNQWDIENKTFGYSLHEIRLGGVKTRLQSARKRLIDYLSGNGEKIEELEQPRLYFDGRSEDCDANPYIHVNGWYNNATVGRM